MKKRYFIGLVFRDICTLTLVRKVFCIFLFLSVLFSGFEAQAITIRNDNSWVGMRIYWWGGTTNPAWDTRPTMTAATTPSWDTSGFSWYTYDINTATSIKVTSTGGTPSTNDLTGVSNSGCYTMSVATNPVLTRVDCTTGGTYTPNMSYAVTGGIVSGTTAWNTTPVEACMFTKTSTNNYSLCFTYASSSFKLLVKENGVANTDWGWCNKTITAGTNVTGNSGDLAITGFAVGDPVCLKLVISGTTESPIYTLSAVAGTPPLTITSDKSNPINQGADVTLTATNATGTCSWEYSQDGSTWYPYIGTPSGSNNQYISPKPMVTTTYRCTSGGVSATYTLQVVIQCSGNIQTHFTENFGSLATSTARVENSYVNTSVYKFSAETYEVQDGYYAVLTNPLYCGRGSNTSTWSGGVVTVLGKVASSGAYWYNDIRDHTGNTNGGMLMVNCKNQGEVTYQRQITDLCKNIYINFTAWFANAAVASSSTPINTQFKILDKNGVEIQSARINVNNIKASDGWVKGSTAFFSGDNESLTVQIINNGTSGAGNDILIDDISFTSCVPQLSITPGLVVQCGEETRISIQSEGIDKIFGSIPYYLWQRYDYSTSKWVDIPDDPIAGSSSYKGSGWDKIYYDYATEYAETNIPKFRVIMSSDQSVAINVGHDIFPVCSNYAITDVASVNCTCTPQEISVLSGNITQNVCSGSSIGNIIFHYGGAKTTGASAINLPAGLTAILDNTTKTLTISGTPTIGGTAKVFAVGTPGDACISDTIMVTTNINPEVTITCPPTSTLTGCNGVHATGATTIGAFTTLGGTTNASSISYIDGTPSLVGCSETTIRTYTGTLSGCSKSCTQNLVRTVDVVKPVITTTATSGDLGCNPSVTAPAFSATDNCDGSLTPTVTTAGPSNTGCSYSQTWTANVSDACGNAANPLSITYTWKQDMVKPVITGSVAAQNATLSGTCIFKIPNVTELVRALSSDNCTNQADLTITQSPTEGTIMTGTTNVIVSVKDGCNNTSSTTINITVPEKPTIQLTSGPTCSADLSTYGLDVTVSSGTLTSTSGTLNHSGNHWTVSNVTKGTNITLTVTDTNGCTENMGITAPDCNCKPQLVTLVSGNANQSICPDKAITTITYNATGTETTGIVIDNIPAGMSVNYTTPTSAELIGTPTSSGTYKVYATGSGATCPSDTLTGDITLYEKPSVTISGIPTTTICPNTTVNLSATSTTSGNNYQWTNATGGVPSSTATFSASDCTETSHDISVLFTDDHGCTNTQSATIKVGDTTAPTFNAIMPLAITCDASDKATQITNWLNTASATDNCSTVTITNNYDIANLPVHCGTLTVIFTAADNCLHESTMSSTITITDTQKPQFNGIMDLSVACDASDKMTQITNWLNAAIATDNCGNPTVTNNYNVANLPMTCGNLTVLFTATDECSNSTTTTSTINITDTKAPTFNTITPLSISCDASDKTIQITNWLNNVSATDNCGTVTISNDYNATNLPVHCGNLTVTFTAKDNCSNEQTTSADISITDTTKPTFTVPADITIYKDADCNYNSSTTITGNVIDEIDNCSTGIQATFTDVTSQGSCTGNLIINRTWSLQDDCGNMTNKVQKITVKDTIAPIINPIPDQKASVANCIFTVPDLTTLVRANTSDNCTANANLSISQSPSAGTIITNLSNDITVTVTDACNNSTNTIVKVIVPTAPEISLTSENNETVLSCSTTSINITATGNNGTAPYTYSLNGSTYQSSNEFMVTSAKNYVVTLQDANGCTAEKSIDITNASNLDFTLASDISTINCTNLQSTITATITQGTAPFQYKIEGGSYQSENTFAVTTGKTYTVTVKDANNCEIQHIITINENKETPIITLNGANDGDKINCKTTSYVLGYDITDNTTALTETNRTWSNGSTTTDITATEAGGFSVQITFSNGCTSNSNVIHLIKDTVTPSLSINAPTTNLTCQTSSIELTAQTDASQYLWNDNSTNQKLTATNAGDYSVSVTGNNGCKTSKSITITSTEDDMSISETITNVTCYQGSNGKIELTVTGGVAPISYNWNNNTYNTKNISNLPAGNYNIEITDSNNCKRDLNITISEPNPLKVSTNPITPICKEESVTLSATVEGGTTNYAYSWDNVSSADASIEVSPSTNTQYTFKVVDANLCEKDTVITVTVNQLPTVSAITGLAKVYIGSTTVLSNLSTLAGVWSISDESIATISNNGEVTPIKAGTPIVYYTVTDPITHCSSRVQYPLSVLDVHPTGIVSGNAHLCPGEEATVTINLTGVPPFNFSYTDEINIISITNYNDTEYTFQSKPDAGTTLTYTLVSLEDAVATADPTGMTGSATVQVNNDVILNASLIKSSPLCPNADIEIQVNGGDNSSLGYTVSEDSNPVSFNYTSGIITITGASVGTHSYSIVAHKTEDNKTCESTPSTISITLEDTTIPEITCGNNIEQNTDEGLCSALVAVPDITFSDNCSTPTLSYEITGSMTAASTVGQVGSRLFNKGINNIIYTAVDEAGNKSSCSITVTIDDAENPKIACATDITVSMDAGVNYATMTNIGSPTASDNCAIDTITNNAPATNMYNKGTTTITWKATDTSTNFGECEQTITVVDTEKPLITCPAPISIECLDDLPQAYTSYTEFTTAGGSTSDNDEVNETSFTLIDEVDDNGVCPKIISRTYQIADVSGNTNTCTQNITISDDIPPQFDTIVPLSVSCSASDKETQINNWLNTVTATDNCSIVTITNNFDINSLTTSCGNVEVTFTAKDGCDNKITATGFITVYDNIIPSFTSTVEPQTASSIGNCGFQVPNLIPTIKAIVTDNCTQPENIIITQTPAANTVITTDTDITILIEDACGNTNSTIVSVVIPDLPTATLTASQTAFNCNLTNITLTASATSGTPTFEYSLDGVTFQTQSTFSVSETGTYTITVKDATGCTNTGNSVTLTQTPTLTLQTNSDKTEITCKSQTATISAIASGGKSPYQFSINGGILTTNTSFTITEGGNYLVEVTDANGCSATSTISIINNKISPTVVTKPLASVCSPETIDISNAVVSSDADIVKYFTDQTLTHEITSTLISQVGNYIYYVAGMDITTGCIGSPVAVPFSINEISVTSVNDTIICENTSATLWAKGIGSQAATYTYDFYTSGTSTKLSSATNGNIYYESVQPDKTSSYNLLVKNGSCNYTKMISVEVTPNPTFDIVDTESGVEVKLKTNANAPYLYRLNDGDWQTSPLFEVNEKGQYEVMVTDANGCSSISTFVIDKLIDIYPEKFFTPNGDGVNDTWEIKNIGYYPNAEIEIYDRFSKKLLTYKGYEKGWNGIYLNHLMPATDYWYIIKIEELGKPRVGHFTLKR